MVWHLQRVAVQMGIREMLELDARPVHRNAVLAQRRDALPVSQEPNSLLPPLVSAMRITHQLLMLLPA